MKLTRRLFLVWLPLLLLVPGCNTSNTPARVSGKITYKGEVVPAGSITFHAPEGGIYPFVIQNGTYTGADLPAVEMDVTIETETANPNARNASYGTKGKEGGNPSEYEKKMRDMGKVPEGPANKGGYLKIPAKYHDKKSANLKRTLTKGENKLDFDLTD